MKNGCLEIRLNDANVRGYAGVEHWERDSYCFDGDARPDFCRCFGKHQGPDRDNHRVLSRRVLEYSSLKEMPCAVLGLAKEEESQLRFCGLVYAIYDLRGWWYSVFGKGSLPRDTLLCEDYRGPCKASFCVLREGEVVRSYASPFQRAHLQKAVFCLRLHEGKGIKSILLR